MRGPSVVALLACAAALAAPVAASGAPGFHDRFDDTFDLPDFCGSGVTVQVRDVVVGNGHESDTGFTFSFNAKTTFTYGDRSITSHAAGRLVEELDGDPEGEHTEFVVETGLRAQLKAPGGGLVQSDAGNLQSSSRSTKPASSSTSRSSRTPATTTNSGATSSATPHPRFSAYRRRDLRQPAARAATVRA